MLIDKRLNSICRIYGVFINANGVLAAPDTSMKITIYKSDNSAPVKVVDAADATSLATGVYYYAWDLSAVAIGTYNAMFTAVDSAESVGYTQEIRVLSGADCGDMDKASGDIVLIFGNFADATGVLTTADTSAVIDIYPANSNTKTIDGAALTEYSTGLYYYAWNVSALAAGNYMFNFTYTHDGVAYSSITQRLLIDSNHIAASISDTGKPKIFDDNLIISADTITEPTGNIAATDLMSYIKDNRSETKLTLRPNWSDAAKVEPDGDMDALTDWTDGDGVDSSALDTTYYITGAKSFLITAEVAASYEMAWAGTTDISNTKIGWIGLRLKDQPTGDISVKLKIDDGTYDYEVTATTDYLGNAIDTIDTWYYVAVNLQGSADIDYTAITGINIKIVNTETEAVDFYIDGLRFTPHVHNFIYEWTAAQDVNLVEIKGCDSLAYDISYYDGSYTSITSGAFDANTDFAIDYDSTGVSATKVKFEINAANYSGGLVVSLGDLLVLTQLYEWQNTARHNPMTRQEISEQSNWLGAKRIFKTRSWFECNIEFDGFTADEEEDIEYIQTLLERDMPFFYWLNGNIVNTDFNVITKEWKRENLYRVYNATDTIKVAPYNGQNKKGNPIEKNTLKLIEAAYIEEL